MWMKRSGKGGWLCVPPEVFRTAGMILIAVGVLLMVIFVPIRYWMALIGLVLVLGGLWLRSC